MKNILLALISVIFLTACDKVKEQPGPIVNDEPVNFSITFTPVQEEPKTEVKSTIETTKPFLGDLTQSKAWEDTIYSLIVFSCDKHGNIVDKIVFSAAELLTLKHSAVTKSFAPGEKYKFYAVANFDAQATTEKELKSAIQKDVMQYNGKIEDLLERGIREKGFIMTATTEATITENTAVKMQLERTVSKVILKTRIGDIWINYSLSHGFTPERVEDLGGNYIYETREIEVKRTARATPLFPIAYDRDKADYGIQKFNQFSKKDFRKEHEYSWNYSEIIYGEDVNIFYCYEGSTEFQFNIYKVYPPQYRYNDKGERYQSSSGGVYPKTFKQNVAHLKRNKCYYYELHVQSDIFSTFLNGNDTEGTHTHDELYHVSSWSVPYTK